MRRLLLWLAAGFAALVAALLGLVAWLAAGSLPRYDGELAVAGLSAPVEILRDEWAVPRIRAQSPEDAYLALGFVHAQDRLWQMEQQRRLVQGRLAEIVGEAALPSDRFMRTLGLYRQAEASVAHMPEEPRRWLEAYARGINAFIDTRERPLPPEFWLLWHAPEPWTVADSLAFTRLMALDLARNWRDELLRARLAQRLSPEQLADLWPENPPAELVTIAAAREALRGLDLDRLAAALPKAPTEGLGSNAWVVSGRFTRSGQPLLANDPHLALEAPGVWYLAALEAPGLAVVGATLPSMPIVPTGRNRRLVWGGTNTGSDVQDLFVERLDPADSGRYLTPEGSAPFVLREETIAVRGRAPERLLVRETRHGPVASDLAPGAEGLAGADRVLALSWTALAADDVSLIAGFALATADGPEALDDALRPFGSPQLNILWADVDGRIGLTAPGRVPVRRSGDGRLPAPGWDGAADWIGEVPFAELPRETGPPTGRIVNANNRLVGPDYPHLLAADWPPALRARRIEALLDGRRDLDAEAFGAMQMDQRSTLADDFLPHLLDAGDKLEGPPGLLAALAAWDRRMDAERPEPLAFAAWYDALAEAVYADELGPLFDAYRGQRSDFMAQVLTRRPVWCDDVTTPALETCAERVALAWGRAMARLAAERGADWRAWRWGEAHRTIMAHRVMGQVRGMRRLSDIALPSGGDGSTVNVAHYRGGDGPRAFASRVGVSLRMIVDLGDPEEALLVTPTGQSGHPLSRHYRDLTPLWSRGELVPVRLAVDAPKHRLLLRPAPPF